jgi:hypothetical protein
MGIGFLWKRHPAKECRLGWHLLLTLFKRNDKLSIPSMSFFRQIEHSTLFKKLKKNFTPGFFRHALASSPLNRQTHRQQPAPNASDRQPASVSEVNNRSPACS